ncbi:hypothetical protein [Gallaecimonas pentaromativorans]|uniref:hypothetical protein n=1 Tax=Gallaecimonas pentaromativorans TaxID=584787 RepID=UPI003A8DC539
MKRPGFNSNKQHAARLEATLATGHDYSKTNLRTADLAAPHRAPYAEIRDLILTGNRHQIRKAVRPMIKASRHVRRALAKVSLAANASDYRRLSTMYRKGERGVRKSYKAFKANPGDTALRRALVVSLNNLPSNAPGLGPHNTVNNPVSDRLHLQPTGQLTEPLSPRSDAARRAFPQVGVASTSSGNVVSVTGATHAPFPTIVNPQSQVTIPTHAPQVRGSLWVTQGGDVMQPSGTTGWKKIT